MNQFIHVICDYGAGDLAWSEVLSALRGQLQASAPDAALPQIHMTAVGSFETVACGFVTAQLALSPLSLRPDPLIVFSNCAPRKDRRAAREDNEGEGFLYALLKNGVHLAIVNSGYSLSFVKEQIQELWSTEKFDRGSQFRSRDFFPNVVAAIAKGDWSFKRNQLDASQIIPDVPLGVVGYVDSFGNIKTTFRSRDANIESLKPGDRLRVIVNNTIRTATVATGSFNVMEGDLAFSPGSSGHTERYWELFKRGGSAFEEFSRPVVGSIINLEIL